ncbi:hypothetical protein [Acidovorax sp. NCPPB 3576]|uniref:hypothetical protein n=1 Tax=Acidovorax sp. NCPPB 3576 TaxID=2940488 RepID=UPI0023493EAA|nr:hypothetical protein [Acidovorax sp. NCPPB 3576]WCM90966.1 hypothetical protein M5C98_22165 [Acidovorax sp. NCPPB 3576]
MRRPITVATALVLLLTGCSPALNWRSVPLENAGLTVLLPCKPDQATRSVDFGGRAADLAMAGCEAEGATFAISHLVVEDPSQAGAGLAQWRVAVLARMQATATDADAAEAGASSFVPSGALALPQSLRLQAQGRRSDGSPVAAQAVWFARLEGQQARLYHAVVYTATPQTAVADTFFAGLVLP